MIVFPLRDSKYTKICWVEQIIYAQNASQELGSGLGSTSTYKELGLATMAM